MSRARNWVFTLNNPITTEVQWTDRVKYAVWQKERVVTTHLQGYVELKNPGRLTELKRLLPGAHWEIRRGSQQQAREYCMKEDSRIEGPWEYGQFIENKQGDRTDMEYVRDMIIEGKPNKHLLMECVGTYIRYKRSWDECRRDLVEPRDYRPNIYILVGPSRSGKTRWAKRNFPKAYWKDNLSKWWDGYNGEEDIVIDEFYGWIPISKLFRLLDRYDERVEVKGGSVWFRGRNITITSNKEPEKWYNEEIDITPLLTRIEEFGVRITDFNTDIIH